MKKIVSTYCCILCLHTVKSIPVDAAKISPKVSGEKVLVKAMSALLNRDGNRKNRDRRIELPPSGRPPHFSGI